MPKPVAPFTATQDRNRFEDLIAAEEIAGQMVARRSFIEQRLIGLARLVAYRLDSLLASPASQGEAIARLLDVGEGLGGGVNEH
ncbi:MAG: hypothetical protein KDE53_23360 [Caldilineaceae bacterium]|nr:hypothetical protein [Caldilineaceae bacterium]